jgi:hypothetical protein
MRRPHARPAQVPWPVRLRFSGGLAVGVVGLGAMGQSVMPFHAGPFLIGVAALLAGLGLTIGTIAARAGHSR